MWSFHTFPFFFQLCAPDFVHVLCASLDSQRETAWWPRVLCSSCYSGAWPLQLHNHAAWNVVVYSVHMLWRSSSVFHTDPSSACFPTPRDRSDTMKGDNNYNLMWQLLDFQVNWFKISPTNHYSNLWHLYILWQHVIPGVPYYCDNPFHMHTATHLLCATPSISTFDSLILWSTAITTRQLTRHKMVGQFHHPHLKVICRPLTPIRSPLIVSVLVSLQLYTVSYWPSLSSLKPTVSVWSCQWLYWTCQQ